MRKTSAMSLWWWIPWSLCHVKCRHICGRWILHEAHAHVCHLYSESAVSPVCFPKRIFSGILSSPWCSAYWPGWSASERREDVGRVCSWFVAQDDKRSLKVLLFNQIRNKAAARRRVSGNLKPVLKSGSSRQWWVWPRGHCPNTVRAGTSIWSFAVWTKLCSVFNPLNLFKAVAFWNDLAGFPVHSEAHFKLTSLMKRTANTAATLRLTSSTACEQDDHEQSRTDASAALIQNILMTCSTQ